jgi:energy-coupling factor transporter transmembrane protein EcfT
MCNNYKMDMNLRIWLHFIILAIILLFTIIHILYMLMVYDNYIITKLFYIIIMVGAIFLLLQPNILLPFLGHSVFPATVIVDEKYPANYSYQYTLELPEGHNGKKVIYWAAKEDKTDNTKVFDNPWVAYDNYENVGVTKVKNNEAVIKLHLPNGYKVGMGREVKPHFHYRICCDKNIMLSQVYTVNI